MLLRVNGAVVTVPDTDPPVFGTAALAADGRTLTLTYDEALNEASTPAATAFEVKATPLGGVEATDLAAMAVVSVAGSTVVLTLAKPIAHDDGTVTVTYTKPASGVIEDAAGNDAGPLTDEAVTNNSQVPRVTIAAVHPDATPGIANPVFRVIRSEHGRGGPGGGPDRHPGRGLPRIDHTDHHHTGQRDHGGEDVPKHPVRQQRQRQPDRHGGGGRGPPARGDGQCGDRGHEAAGRGDGVHRDPGVWAIAGRLVGGRGRDPGPHADVYDRRERGAPARPFVLCAVHHTGHGDERCRLHA